MICYDVLCFYNKTDIRTVLKDKKVVSGVALNVFLRKDIRINYNVYTKPQNISEVQKYNCSNMKIMLFPSPYGSVVTLLSDLIKISV